MSMKLHLEKTLHNFTYLFNSEEIHHTSYYTVCKHFNIRLHNGRIKKIPSKGDRIHVNTVIKSTKRFY